jgi:hypothetical protein
MSTYASRDPISSKDAVLLAKLELIEYQVDKENINSDPTAQTIVDTWYTAANFLYGDQPIDDRLLADREFEFDAYYSAAMKMAELNHADAQYKLFLYYKLIDEPNTALSWLERAAGNGHLYAKFFLFRIHNEGGLGTQSNTDAARRALHDLTHHLQEEYFMVTAYADDQQKLSYLEDIGQRVSSCLDTRRGCLRDQQFVLRKQPNLPYLGDKDTTQRAIIALNDYLEAYKIHLDPKKHTWIAANHFQHDKLLIDENSHVALRPMAIVTFILQKDQISITDNLLFKQLLFKMKINCVKILGGSPYTRSCVLSVDDVDVLNAIPGLCDSYNLKKITIIPDFFQAQKKIPLIRPVHVEDESTTRRRNFLLRLKSEVDDTKWNDKAVHLFSTSAPDHILDLRDALKFLTTQTDNHSIHSLFLTVKMSFDNLALRKRHPDVIEFYKRTSMEINEIIHNKPAKQISSNYSQ